MKKKSSMKNGEQEDKGTFWASHFKDFNHDDIQIVTVVQLFPPNFA